MGTRHVHCLKQPKGGYRFQYLQFDGYPSYQLGRVLQDIMPKVMRMDMDFGRPGTAERTNMFRAFLDAYLTLRSFDSGHSIGNTWKGKMPEDVEEFGTKCWAEYVYVYDPVQVSLTVQSVGTGVAQEFDLLDETQQRLMGFDPNAYGQCNDKRLKAFCKQVEDDLRKEDENS